MKLIFWFIGIALLSCSGKGSLQSVIDLPVKTVASYSDSLRQLPFVPNSALAGLDLYSKYYAAADSNQNDESLVTYLKFQVVLMDTLTRQMYRRPDFQSINSLIWADTALHEQAGRQFEDDLNSNGLEFASTEGILYITRNFDPIRAAFYSHLTRAGKVFFDEFEKEQKEGFLEDDGLVISAREVGDRLVFWDNFRKNFATSVFQEYARNSGDDYLRVLLTGTDNSPAFEGPNSTMDPAFLEACQWIAAQDPHLESVKVVVRYLEILKANGYRNSDELEKFCQSQIR